jgi:hypothetical protein
MARSPLTGAPPAHSEAEDSADSYVGRLRRRERGGLVFARGRRRR